MRHFNKKIALILLALFVVPLLFTTGCGSNEEGTTSSEQTQSTGSVDNTIENTSLELVTVDGIPYPKMEVEDKKITFLSHWDENGSEMENIKDRLKKVYGLEIDFTTVTYTMLPNRLFSLQASQDAPDVFIYYNNGFPSMFSRDMFLPIDDFVDFNDGFWAPAKNASDLLMWNGKRYMVTSAGISRYLWYNKTIFDRNGLEDPLALYKKNEWTWEKLYECAAELTQDTDADGNIDQWGIGGNSIVNAMSASLDYAQIALEDGKIVNHVKDPKGDTIWNMFTQAATVDRSFTWDWQNLFRGGSLAMVYEGHWIAGGDEILTQMVKDGEVSFVPQPRFADQTENRFATEKSGFLIPRGAKNVKGAQAFITGYYAYNRSQTSKQAILQRNKEEYGWNDDMLKFYEQYTQGQDFLNDRISLMCGDALRYMGEPMRRIVDGGETWATLKEEYYPLFQAEIDKEVAKMNQ